MNDTATELTDLDLEHVSSGKGDIAVRVGGGWGGGWGGPWSGFGLRPGLGWGAPGFGWRRGWW